MVKAFEELFVHTARAIDADDKLGSTSLNADFHNLAQSFAGSKTLDHMLESVSLKLSWLLQKHQTPALFFQEHQELLSAVKARDDARIRLLTHKHLRTVFAQTLITNPHMR